MLWNNDEIFSKLIQNESFSNYLCKYWQLCSWHPWFFAFRFREKQIMCRNICSHLTIFPLTHLITSFNESRKNLTDKQAQIPKDISDKNFYETEIIKMFLQKPLDGFVKAWKQLFFSTFFKTWPFYKSDIWLDILMKIFFWSLSFYHKNRVLVFKEVWNVFFSVFKLLLSILQKPKLMTFWWRFFLVSLSTIKIEFWSSKRFGIYSFLSSNCYFWYFKKQSW